MITQEEADKIKEHLLKQLDNFPEDKREQIATQITSMTNEQVEAFIQQNKLTHLGGQCIFCSIVAEQTPSYKIAEDNKNIAILELNPVSKGHTLIVPKEHLEEIPIQTKEFAQIVARKLADKLSPNEVQINEQKIMNHALLEVVPIFGDEGPRRQASEEELKTLQKQITKKEENIIKEKPKEKEEIPILPPRIP